MCHRKMEWTSTVIEIYTAKAVRRYDFRTFGNAQAWDGTTAQQEADCVTKENIRSDMDEKTGNKVGAREAKELVRRGGGV